MNVYPVKVTVDGMETNVSLRLDLNAIRTMQEAEGKDILDIITETTTNPVKMAALLDNALHYTNNHNPHLTGDQLFDLLVDSGKCGMDDWMELSNNIAYVSGIIKPSYGNAILASVRKKMTSAIEKLEQGEDLPSHKTQTPEQKEKAE